MQTTLRQTLLPEQRNRLLRRLVRRVIGDDAFLRKRILPFVFDYRVEDSLIVDRLGELALMLDFKAALGRLMFFSGNFEADEIRLAATLIKRYRGSPIVLDIGANIGVHSLLWAKACPAASFFAFEPAPDTVSLLARNVSLNSLAERVTVVSKAVSNREGMATFYVSADNALSSLKDTRRSSVKQTIEVPLVTLDTIARDMDVERLSFIKIDVEGFETEVLEGGAQVLSTRRPDLFVEIYRGSHSNPDPERTIQLAKSFGYHSFVMKHGRLEPYVRHDDRYYNYFFLSSPDF